MKMRKLILLLGILSILLSGCNYEAILNRAFDELSQQMTEPQPQPTIKPEKTLDPIILFSEKEVEDLEDLEKLRQLEPQELQNYVSQYRDYNTYTYFSHLNDTEKLVYHAYEYAMDEALPYFWIDDRLLLGMERSTFQVLEFLSLDSALVEQNYSHLQGSYTEPTGATYTSFFVENFTREKLNNKKQAIIEARLYLSWNPNWKTASDWKAAPDREMAEYIYDILGEYISYETNIEGKEYLYNGLYNLKTNCDGYTNAFALMCAIADIPCIEINSDTPKGETGHTWNAVFLEGKWVHVDATGAGEDFYSECENCRQERMYFGFSDALLEEKVLYTDIVPSCPEGLSSVVQIPSARDVNFFNIIKAEFERNNRQFAVILLDQGEIDDQTFDELVQELNCGLYYIYYETAEGKTAYYLFNND